MENISILNSLMEASTIEIKPEHNLWAAVVERAIRDCDPKWGELSVEARKTIFDDPHETKFIYILNQFGDGEELLNKIRRTIETGEIFKQGRVYRTTHKKRKAA